MGMSLAEWTKRLHELFVAEFLKPGKVVELARRTGISDSLLYRARNGQAVTLETIFQVHESLGLDARDFLLRVLGVEESPHQAFLRNQLSACVVLELHREPPTGPPDPFLAKVDVLVGNTLALPRPAGPVVASLRPRLLSLEEERLRNRRRAKRQLETMALRLGRQLATAPSRGQLADLAGIVISWAAVQRMAGRRNDAIGALRCAWALVEVVAEPWTTGFWYQKGGYLLQDLAQPELAHDFALRSGTAFGEGGHLLEIAQTLVDRGRARYYCGDHIKAAHLFACATETLPKSAAIYRYTAHTGLARSLRELADLKGATRQLELASALAPANSVEFGHLRWEQACLAVALGRHENAFAKFREAMAVMGSCGHTIDLIFIALDFAEALVRLNRPKDAGLLAAEISRFLALFDGSTRLRRISEDLLAMIGLGTIELTVVESARERLARAGYRPAVSV